MSALAALAGCAAGRSLLVARTIASQARAAGTMALIKELRERTQAPVAEVKAAVEEAQGDVEAALRILKTKGMVAAAKKAGRQAAEGLVALRAQGARCVALAEVNCETDFAARGPLLQALVGQAAQAALAAGERSGGAGPGPQSVPLEGWEGELAGGGEAGSKVTLGEEVRRVAGLVRENVRLRRAVWLGGGGRVYGYVHNEVVAGSGVGRMAGAVALEGADAAAADEMGPRVAMHVVAMRPRYLDAGEVPAAVLEEQKAIFASQGEQMGKPAHVVAKMAEGRVRKWQGEVCLAMQPFVVDPDTTVEKALAKRGLRVTGFARVEVGEGIEADAGTGFADEVRRLASGAKS